MKVYACRSETASSILGKTSKIPRVVADTAFQSSHYLTLAGCTKLEQLT